MKNTQNLFSYLIVAACILPITLCARAFRFSHPSGYQLDVEISYFGLLYASPHTDLTFCVNNNIMAGLYCCHESIDAYDSMSCPNFSFFLHDQDRMSLHLIHADDLTETCANLIYPGNDEPFLLGNNESDCLFVTRMNVFQNSNSFLTTFEPLLILFATFITLTIVNGRFFSLVSNLLRLVISFLRFLLALFIFGTALTTFAIAFVTSIVSQAEATAIPAEEAEDRFRHDNLVYEFFLLLEHLLIEISTGYFIAVLLLLYDAQYNNDAKVYGFIPFLLAFASFISEAKATRDDEIDDEGHKRLLAIFGFALGAIGANIEFRNVRTVTPLRVESFDEAMPFRTTNYENFSHWFDGILDIRINIQNFSELPFDGSNYPEFITNYDSALNPLSNLPFANCNDFVSFCDWYDKLAYFHMVLPHRYPFPEVVIYECFDIMYNIRSITPVPAGPFLELFEELDRCGFKSINNENTLFYCAQPVNTYIIAGKQFGVFYTKTFLPDYATMISYNNYLLPSIFARPFCHIADIELTERQSDYFNWLTAMGFARLGALLPSYQDSVADELPPAYVR